MTRSLSAIAFTIAVTGAYTADQTTNDQTPNHQETSDSESGGVADAIAEAAVSNPDYGKDIGDR